MTSSMLSGERRWASARRGGMTVLGKVAVPKPINLPSQRLENHGLDPNVEIVPKGSHGWGSKSSSSSSNAWGSPNTDGGTGSPSFLNGRPSSGGTGTRPSTAGSDRANDLVANAWGSSSRPSSSSGALTSNQTSLTALRPRSAETRPGSSQLSRFAEPLSDNAGPWGGSGTSEKLGMTSSKNDGFSLSTGDFPSLGSEKDNSGKNTDSKDYGSHGRRGSPSSGVASVKEHTGGDFSVNVNSEGGGSGSWRKESSTHVENGSKSNMEKWHADPHPYPNSNIHHSQHFDSWHGPPVNSHPGGAWYRGPPGGPPFGSPIPPGGFPMEPFPYFHPHMPPLANSHPVRPPNTAPRGSHPKNGDMYRPHMHDPYARPGMSLRPGFYPGPVPFDNYYGPPMGFSNSNERDVPFMGMPMGPATYNRYPGHNVADPINSHGRTSTHGPTSNPMAPEQEETVHPHDARGPYKVLLKQHDSWEGRDQEQKWDGKNKTNSSHSLKGEPPRKSSWEDGWRKDDRIDYDMAVRKTTLDEGTSCEAAGNQAAPLKVKSPEIVACENSSDDNSVKKFEHGASNFPEVMASKDSSLIQKIEGLNAKARSCEAYGGGNVNSALHEDRFALGDESIESTVVGGTTIARKSTHGKADHHGRMRYNIQEVDGWRKETNVLEAHISASSVHSEVSFAFHGPENNFAATQNSMVNPSGKDDGLSILHVSDVNESQRAKRNELANRIKQREKEEEERTREQRAKALAKLEELNRRTQSGESVAEKMDTIPSRQESSTPAPLSGTGNKAGASSLSLSSQTNAVVHKKEKLETVAISAVQNKLEESSIAAPASVVASKSVLGSAMCSSHGVIAETDKSNVNKVEKSASIVGNVSLETPTYAHNESDGNVDAVSSNSSSHIHDGSTAKQKRSAYRQKQNSSMERNANDKLVFSSTTEACKGYSAIASNTTICFGSIGDEIASNFETNLSINPRVTSESLAHNRKKSRSGKNRHKAEEAPSAAALPTKDTAESSGESARPKTSEAISVQSMTSLTGSNQSSDLHSSLANEEGHVRLNNQLKSQHPRRTMRNHNGTKSSDKNHCADAVVWAPVRSQNKVEVSDEAMHNVSVEMPMKSNQQVQNNPKSKRAEMERYIPKPVAKELSHQGSSHQANVASSKITSNDAVERHESGIPAIESRSGDIRQNKPGKVHGSWRQRGMVESATNPNPSRNFQKLREDHQHPDEWNDGWNMPENPEPAVNVSVSKDQGVVARGKRHQHKGHKGMEHNHNPDEKKNFVVQSATGETDSPVVAKENHAVGERSASHWQPKTQPLPVTDQRGSQPNSRSGNPVVSEGGRANRKESARHGDGPLLPQPNKDASSGRSHQSLSEKTNFEEAERHQGPRRERKTVGQRGRPVTPVELTSHSNAGLPRNGNANSRYSKEHESHGEWNGPGKDNKQQAVWDRQKSSNLHYEYQPVGPPHNNESNNFETPRERSGPRYRERGQQGQSRRGGGGNFSGRQSGSVQVGYE